MQIPATGIAKTLLNLYGASLKIKPSIKFTGLHNKPIKYSLLPNIQTLQIGPYMPRNLWMTVCLPIYARSKKPDIIHFPWNGDVPRFLGSITVVTTINDVLPIIIPDFFKSKRQENRYKNKIQKSIDRSKLITTISEFSKQQIINNFEVNNEIVVITPDQQLNQNLANITCQDLNISYLLEVMTSVKA